MQSTGPSRPQEGMNSYSQGDLQRMIRQVSDLYTQTAEATAKELEDTSSLSEAGGENFKVSIASAPVQSLLASPSTEATVCTPGRDQG